MCETSRKSPNQWFQTVIWDCEPRTTSTRVWLDHKLRAKNPRSIKEDDCENSSTFDVLVHGLELINWNISRGLIKGSLNKIGINRRSPDQNWFKMQRHVSISHSQSFWPGADLDAEEWSKHIFIYINIYYDKYYYILSILLLKII